MKTLTYSILFVIAFAFAAPVTADIVTYDLSASGFNNGSTVVGTLSLDLDLVADATDISIAELNVFATYNLGVNYSTTNFVLNEANSTLDLFGSGAIAASTSELTFDISNGGIGIRFDDDASIGADTLSFLDFGDSILRIGNTTGGANLDEKNLGAISPSFTFSNSVVPEPSSLVLCGLGGVFVAFRRRRIR